MHIALIFFLQFAVEFSPFILLAIWVLVANYGDSFIKRDIGPWLRILIYSAVGSLTAVLIHFLQDESAKSESIIDFCLIVIGLTVLLSVVFAPFVFASQWRINRSASQKITADGTTETSSWRQKGWMRVVLFSGVLLTWVIWIYIKSWGFTEIRPIAWLIFFGCPIAAYSALLAFPTVQTTLRKASKEVRYLLSATIMWFFSVGAWGYIWRWDNDLTFEQYIALFVLPVIGIWLGFMLWKWSKTP